MTCGFKWLSLVGHHAECQLSPDHSEIHEDKRGKTWHFLDSQARIGWSFEPDRKVKVQIMADCGALGCPNPAAPPITSDPYGIYCLKHQAERESCHES